MFRNLCRFSLCGLSFNGRYLALELFIRVWLIVTEHFLLRRHPFVRRVYGVDWYNYYFPYAKKEQFAFSECLLIWLCLTIALLILVFVTLKVWKKMPRKLIQDDVINFFLGLTLAFLLAMIVTEVIKNMYGRLRPDFLSRCLGEETRGSWGPVETMPAIPECTNPHISKFELLEGRRSFPSGHSAMAMATELYLGLFLWRKLTQIKNTGSLRLVLPTVLVLFGFAIMITRTSDYRHNPTDVLAGGVIGTFIGVGVWVFYDIITQQTYQEYRETHDISSTGYKHDPFWLSTPAQCVPVKKFMLNPITGVVAHPPTVPNNEAFKKVSFDSVQSPDV